MFSTVPPKRVSRLMHVARNWPSRRTTAVILWHSLLVLPDTQGEHDGVTHYEHLDTGIPGTLECGDARGVAGMLTPTALFAVASVMWQAWLP